MSILIDKESFNIGIELCQHTIHIAIRQYEIFLVTYGTAPDMSIVEKLDELCSQITKKD